MNTVTGAGFDQQSLSMSAAEVKGHLFGEWFEIRLAICKAQDETASSQE